MNHKHEIRKLAWLVKEGLNTYIEIHNNIFNESSTLKSFIKNIFGKGVPMENLLVEAEKLIPLWDSIQNKVKDFKNSNSSTLTSEELQYFEILIKYVNSVRNTITALVERQRLMSKGSKSFSNNPMTWEAYKKKEIEYKNAVEDYTSIGQQLNDAGLIIFN